MTSTTAAASNPASRLSVEPFLVQTLGGLGEEWKTVTLKDLQFFYRNPSRFFVEKRLEFRLPTDKDLLQEEEPFSVDGLDAFAFKQEILDFIQAAHDFNILNGFFFITF